MEFFHLIISRKQIEREILVTSWRKFDQEIGSKLSILLLLAKFFMADQKFLNFSAKHSLSRTEQKRFDRVMQKPNKDSNLLDLNFFLLGVVCSLNFPGRKKQNIVFCKSKVRQTS
jgi:hypothetical protein